MRNESNGNYFMEDDVNPGSIWNKGEKVELVKPTIIPPETPKSLNEQVQDKIEKPVRIPTTKGHK